MSARLDAARHEYYRCMHATNAACCLENYKRWGHHSYLDRAIKETVMALAAYHRKVKTLMENTNERTS